MPPPLPFLLTVSAISLTRPPEFPPIFSLLEMPDKTGLDMALASIAPPGEK